MIRPHAEYELDDSRERLDFEAVHRWLSSAYWSPGIDRETVERGARFSTVVVGAYLGSEQVGYMRVVSDTTRFAWICDVFVDENHRGKAIGRAMVRFALEHPDLRNVYRWALATRDAHEVYRSAGFTEVPEPRRWMQYINQEAS